MKLVVFDLDGTLVDTHRLEGHCYERAILETLGLPAIDSDWSRYRHMSDWGIAAEAYEAHFGRKVSLDDLERAATRFMELLREIHANQPTAMFPVAGAGAVLAALPARGWAAAVATGGWRRSAEYKLAFADHAKHEMPMATTEDGPARVEIVTTAIRRAEEREGHGFERIVSVGDGVWDVKAAIDLGLPFIGIGSGDYADRLRAAGAAVVIPDLGDLENFFAHLRDAPAPALTR